MDSRAVLCFGLNIYLGLVFQSLFFYIMVQAIDINVISIIIKIRHLCKNLLANWYNKQNSVKKKEYQVGKYAQFYCKRNKIARNNHVYFINIANLISFRIKLLNIFIYLMHFNFCIS